MKPLHRILSVTGLALLLGSLLISLGNAPAAAGTAATGWEEMGAGSASGGGISQTGSAHHPWLAIGPDDNPIVAWSDGSSSNLDIYTKRWDGAAWVEMGTDSASGGGISQNDGFAWSPSVAIGPDGNPVVAWEDDSSINPEIYIKRWNGSAWVEIGAGSASGGGISQTRAALSPSLAIGPDGNPVVAWQDFSGSSYSLRKNIYVRRWDGVAWVEMGAGSASGEGISETASAEDPSIAIGPDGMPIVVWQDEVNRWGTGGNDEIYVKRWDGSAWVEMGPGSASGGGISNNAGHSYDPSPAIGPDGNLVVVWTNTSSSNAEIYVKRWNGSAWVELGPGSASGGGVSNNAGDSGQPSLVIDPDGVPVVAWSDKSSGNYEIYARRYASEPSCPSA